ncbi:MAG: protein-disulfide reductase DsbD domain-containing protein, partial [Pseudomonadota bacterium]
MSVTTIAARGAALAFAVLATLVVAQAARANPVATANVEMEVFAETQRIAPGETIWLAVRQTIREGWHTYWRNPGDAGQGTEFNWRLPEGLTAGEIHWPAPERIREGPVTVYGYHDTPVFLVPLYPDDGFVGA